MFKKQFDLYLKMNNLFIYDILLSNHLYFYLQINYIILIIIYLFMILKHFNISINTIFYLNILQYINSVFSNNFCNYNDINLF